MVGNRVCSSIQPAAHRVPCAGFKTCLPKYLTIFPSLILLCTPFSFDNTVVCEAMLEIGSGSGARLKSL